MTKISDQEMNRYALLRAIRVAGDVPLVDLEKLLWRDEAGDVFMLTKGAEIFLYSGYSGTSPGSGPVPDSATPTPTPQLGMYVWSTRLLSWMRQLGLISHDLPTDDSFHHIRTDIANLPLILSLGQRFVRRPRLHGTFISRRERELGHRILPFRPELGRVQEEGGGDGR
jgi:hypothetical protein